MNKNVGAAIVAAVNAYIQEESKAAPHQVSATSSQWKLSGLRELMQKRNLVRNRMR